jgi:hypothetical protein
MADGDYPTIGAVAVDVRANLDPYQRDLGNARAQADRFFSVVQPGMDRVALSTDKAAEAQDGLNGSLKDANVIYVNFNKNLRDTADASDSFSESADQTRKSLLDVGTQTLTTSGHLKTMAVTAYALSPAFRGVVNSGITKTLEATGISAAASAKGLSMMQSATSFLGRIAVPVLAAAAAYEIFNMAISQGTALMEKYRDAHRESDRSDLAEMMKKLSRYQNDVISAQQIARATELSTRLFTAQSEIKRILETQLDLTDPALKFASIWVSINEGVAGTLRNMVSILDIISRGAQTAGNSGFMQGINDFFKKYGTGMKPELPAVCAPREMMSRIDTMLRKVPATPSLMLTQIEANFKAGSVRSSCVSKIRLISDCAVNRRVDSSVARAICCAEITSF